MAFFAAVLYCGESWRPPYSRVITEVTLVTTQASPSLYKTHHKFVCPNQQLLPGLDVNSQRHCRFSANTLRSHIVTSAELEA